MITGFISWGPITPVVGLISFCQTHALAKLNIGAVNRADKSNALIYYRLYDTINASPLTPNP